ncbi:HlyD family efflux transporter periplasmic adaptor subunit [Erythrobacter sp. F6033]|uniref:HlyD family efflux transporter periplasmic adaptor subunit n=1 Tax=Erythrobacter sp. F6033 TaxID=2926401 RepID=UPI001FF30CA6|nr:HlyD family efflux transporter periplasmic adaptor subunit [Erythrobacter sp. F6033]MCK0129256.1 HlyD family efflux transporter periplasmic adaptor subunit [Erythrobacter sp. F6033]
MTAAAILIDLPAASPPPLPALRQELRIEPGAPLINGAPSWTLFDPVRHAFFQLGRVEFIIFSHWASGKLVRIGPDLERRGLSADDANEALNSVIEFAATNGLTVGPVGRDSVAAFMEQSTSNKKAAWKWLLDNYLFIRIPLVKPARFLDRTIDAVRPLWSFYSLVFFVVLALTSLFLVSRQWDAFIASFLYFFSWQGLIAYGAGLFFVKILHELGHAYTATRYGCRVPTMGVSFLVMMPVLYTDTTSAWRLTSRKKRLAIDCAGVATELMVASVATMAWVLLPDGTARSVAFILATTSWIMSLAINLNPFMRFDGYYVLSDFLNVPNLQPRAFALGKWKMREVLFSLGAPAPEAVPDKMRNGMILYAYGTWIYRLFLFTGIAILVYNLFFQPLGLILAVVELAVFIGRPVYAELREWNGLREQIVSSRRGKAWLWVLGGLLIAAFLPLDRHVDGYAVLTPVGAAPIVSGEPARVVNVITANGQRVAAGDPIIELEAPELRAEAASTKVRIAQLELQMGRSGSDDRDRSNRAVIERELARERNKLSGLERRADKLILRAASAGIVSGLTPDIHVGRWISGEEVLAHVVTPSDYDVQAYVPEDEIWRLEQGALGTFVASDAGGPSRSAKLVELSSSAVARLEQPILASTNGGPIAVDKSGEELAPREALYRVRMIAEKGAVRGDGYQIQLIPGTVQIRTEGRSFAQWAATQLARMARRVF